MFRTLTQPAPLGTRFCQSSTYPPALLDRLKIDPMLSLSGPQTRTG